MALTTSALSKIPRHKLADAAGLNSFVRQLGGSAGLALSATLLTRFSAGARAGLFPSVTAGRPEVAGLLQMMNGWFVSRGLLTSQAQNGALAVLQGWMSAQAALLAFEKVFFLQGIIFLAALPLLYFLRVPRKQSRAPAHGPMLESE